MSRSVDLDLWLKILFEHAASSRSVKKRSSILSAALSQAGRAPPLVRTDLERHAVLVKHIDLIAAICFDLVENRVLGFFNPRDRVPSLRFVEHERPA